MIDSTDFTSLEIVYQGPSQDDVAHLRRAADAYRRAPTAAECLDLLVVIVEGDADIILPVNAEPTDTVNAFVLDLCGSGELFPVEAESLREDEHTAPGWTSFVERIQRRNRVLLPPRTVTPYGRFPSDAVPVKVAFRPHGRKATQHIAILERATRSVVNVPISGQGLRQSHQRFFTVDLVSGDRTVQAHCAVPGTAVSGPEDELAAMCFERLAQLDSATFKDLLVLIDAAYTRDSRLIGINVPQTHPNVEAGTGIVTWAELGRRRGWVNLDKHGRRQLLRGSIEALIGIRFTWDYTEGERVRRVSNIPLFYQAGVVSEPDSDRRGYLLGFNELLWTLMVKSRRAIVYDRAILTTTTAQDWHFWIYEAFCIRLSRSWLTQGLSQSDGCLQMQLDSLLRTAGLDYEDQLRRKGPRWFLRTRIEPILRDLTRPTWDGRSLIARYALTPHPTNVLETKVKLWPTASLIRELNAQRPKAADSRAHRLDRGGIPPTK